MQIPSGGGGHPGGTGLASATSLESLSLLDLRRASISRSSQSSTLDALANMPGCLASLESEEVGVGIASSGHSPASPCVPAVVMMCIRHLEQYGLHTVGIFRVSSSKRRVKQVSLNLAGLNRSPAGDHDIENLEGF